MTMIFDIVTLFPEIFDAPLRHSILGRARATGLISINLINIRDYADGRHRVTDDYPYGGGRGMIMKPEPILKAISSVKNEDMGAYVVLLSPQGIPLSHALGRCLADQARLTLICGHYEGVDERVCDQTDLEVSIGDYVLTGGEFAALVLIDVVSRFVPGVLGDEKAVDDDSFSPGLLEHPQYTRPREYAGRRVPDVLLSGDHEAIRRWRRRQALRKTLQRRPDLLATANLSDEDREILKDLQESPDLM
jgi:tRNA (guanine37-N1)-methyltransferase